MVDRRDADNRRGEDNTHSHDPVVHEHNHYLISHHHRDNMVLGESGLIGSQRTHTCAPTRRSVTRHDYDLGNEQREHDHEAHVHDHESPANSPG